MSSACRIEDFRYLTPLWTFRAKDRSVLLPPGVDPLVILGADYSVGFTCGGLERTITIPKGLVHDGPSVPRAFQWLVSKFGRHFEAAVLHDWLYGSPATESREFADAVFLAAMTAAGVSRFKRWIIYRAVRAFGEKSYAEAENRFVSLPPPPPDLALVA